MVIYSHLTPALLFQPVSIIFLKNNFTDAIDSLADFSIKLYIEISY